MGNFALLGKSARILEKLSKTPDTSHIQTTKWKKHTICSRSWRNERPAISHSRMSVAYKAQTLVRLLGALFICMLIQGCLLNQTIGGSSGANDETQSDSLLQVDTNSEFQTCATVFQAIRSEPETIVENAHCVAVASVTSGEVSEPILLDPLHLAVISNDLQATRVLLDSGFSPTRKSNGVSALDLAFLNYASSEIYSLLMSYSKLQ